MAGITKAERQFRDDMAAYGLKYCSGCKLFLPVGMFGRDSSKADGMRRMCTGCKAVRDTQHYAGSREQIRARRARRYALTPGKDRERNALWRCRNPDKNRAKSRRHRAMKARVFRAAYDESAILARNGGRCVYCDAEPATALDHFVPLSWGSDDAAWNLVGACVSCNSSKCDADPYAWLESRGVDVDAWERRHIAGWFDLPRKLWKIQRVYRPPLDA